MFIFFAKYRGPLFSSHSPRKKFQLCILVLLSVSGCTSRLPYVTLHFDDSQVHSQQMSQDPFITANKSEVNLSGAINETVSFQFHLTPAYAALIRPTFRILPLTSIDARMDRSVFEIFREQEVQLKDFPGWHIRSILPENRNYTPLDILVPINAPRGGLPKVMRPDKKYSFWVDVNIPKGTFEGDYDSKIEILSRGKIVQTFDIHLTVWPMILPNENIIPIIAEVDHRDLFLHHIRYRGRPYLPARDDWKDAPVRKDMDALLHTTVKMLQSHRLTPVLSDLSPVISVNVNGQVNIDWDTYDAIVEPIMNGRMFTNRLRHPAWPIPVHDHFLNQDIQLNDLQNDMIRGSNRFRRQYIKACADHFKEKGWLGRAYAMNSDDHGFDKKSISSLLQFADIVKLLQNKIRIATTRFPQDMKPFGWVDYPFADLTHDVNIWSPPAQYYDPQVMEKIRSQGLHSWLTLDRPPFSGSISVFAPATYTRVITWQAEQLGVETIMLGCINQWPADRIDPDPNDCIQSDPNLLLYPGLTFGLDHPVASVRLKHLRRSLQDAAYRNLLHQHDLQHINLALIKALSSYAGSDAYRTHFADGRNIGWHEHGQAYETAKSIMAEQLLEKAYRRKTTRRVESFSNTAKWRRFMLSVNKINLRVDGCRVRLIGSNPNGSAEVECGVTLFNHTRTLLSGKLRFMELPDDRIIHSQAKTISTIGPNESRRFSLTATVQSISTDTGGIFTWPIIFTTDDGVEYTVDARIAMISSEVYLRSINIDGNLSDWPGGTTNVASNFQSIAGVSTKKNVPQTTGLVMRDEKFLYVAINVFQQDYTSKNISRSNTITYDDLIPTQDDVVELLFDPLNAGARSPSDLYHIVIKPSGAYLTEKGIRLNAPCSHRVPWTTDITVATDIHANGWVVEFRIPFSAFEVPAVNNEIWGFSITRFDAERQLFSTWSGSVGNAYDPMSLGNLFIP